MLRDEKRDAGSPTTCRTFKAVQVRTLNCSSRENLAGWQELEIVNRGLQFVPIRELSQQTTPRLTNLQHKIKQNHKMSIIALPKWDRTGQICTMGRASSRKPELEQAVKKECGGMRVETSSRLPPLVS